MPSGISSSSTSHTISGTDSVYMFPNTTPGKGPVTIIPQLYHRHVFGDYSGVPDKKIFGGANAGRFYDQQIPFIGNNGFYSANYRTVSLLRCDLRWNFLPNQYLTGIVNYLEASDSVCDYFNHEAAVDGYPRSYGFWGGALKYTYASKIGPISIDTQMSGFNRTGGVYLSVGYDFQERIKFCQKKRVINFHC